VNGPLALVATVALLALAAFAGLTALRDRPIGRAHLLAAAAAELAVLVLAGAALVAIAGGERPAQPATFAGYLVTAVLLVPAGVALARMEPTRWGAAILAGAALVVPVLVLRLGQVWTAAGG